MSRQSFTYYLYFCLVFNLSLKAQISPGKLSEAHAHLEGLANCTQCHSLGDQVPDSKCLNCHSEIDQLIKIDRGYHSNENVKEASCVSCHNDHHGRKFDMIRFEEASFNHDLAGYKLEGAHEELDCRSCHKPDLISDQTLADRDGTYLGMDVACNSCHSDVHQGTLSNECSSCHNEESFVPATMFDHQITAFPLLGSHESVDCRACHLNASPPNTSVVRFDQVAFESCKDCHQDPHKSQLPGDCKQCHSEISFNSRNKLLEFNHQMTEFNLKGSHQSVDCFKCHENSSITSNIFQDLIGITENACIACHQDVHDGRLGNDCAGCHNESGFIESVTTDNFNHSLTAFPLEGLHINVDCRNCHEGSMTDPLQYSNCFSCHDDYHNKEFTTINDRKDCKECHSVDHDFGYTTYNIFEHNQSSFPLLGAHQATPCFSCHLIQDQWTFRQIGLSCYDCHDDIHDGTITQMYYPEKDCKACHDEENWSSVSFDHNKTGWALVGNHNEVSCSGCHENIDESLLMFIGTQNQCASCHDDIHNEQFALDGISDCSRCHTPDSWNASMFDHDLSRFPLTGVHKEIKCTSCHKIIQSASSDQEYINYKIKSFDCIDCHTY